MDAGGDVTTLLSAGNDISELGGIVGFAGALMEGIGEWGVGLFTLLETVFPPIPSEVILPASSPNAATSTASSWS
jgi:membrane protein DedA with SNARE-associated domain